MTAVQSTTSLAIAVAGATGRMGHMLIEAIAQSHDCHLAGALDIATSPALGQDASAWTGQATATLPAPGSSEGWGRQVTIKKVDSSNNPVLVVADGSAGPDGAMVVLGKFGDFVTVISNGAQWYIASRYYDTPITGWASPDGGGFNRGVYNTDEISNVGWEYSRDVVNAINFLSTYPG